ncbi:MAG: hypothetical protein H0X26_04455 [Alphaproteobacteria bacterium]|nr:hypothetical protein [Alphaproteobacteria bacterium]
MKWIYNTLLTLAFIFLLVSPRLAYCTQSILIYRDFGHKGDESQVRGVVKAYSHLHKDVEVTEFNVGDEEKLRASVKNAVSRKEEKPIVLAVGEKTVASCGNPFPFEGATTVHLCHMITTHHPSLVGKVDYIAVPIHAMGDFAKTVENTNTKLIATIGVAHNRQIEEIEQVYASEKAKLPENVSHTGVILGGDAPTPDGKTQLFTEANARELARYIAPLIKDRHLLITNGPRTGKYDPRTKEEIKTAHRDGKRDHITLAFLDELEKSEISPKQYTLFDFQFGSPSKDMDLLLGAVNVTKGEMLVAGESTSSISESIDVMPAGAVIVYDTTSMNQVHNAHVKSELDTVRIKYLPMGYNGLTENKEASVDTAQKSSAAETIAAALIK